MPEGIISSAAARAGGFLRDLFEWPELVPWSELGPEVIEMWGHGADGKMTGEHWEITGQSGSGKSYTEATILQQRARRFNSAEIAIVTKQQDDSIPLLGWPEVSRYSDLRQYRQAVFWPKTRLQGQEREKFHEARIYELLSKLWTPDANVVLAFDEIGYVHDLSHRMRKMIRMYWREGRSHGISILAMKQRPVGVVRDQHSESRWKAVFPPADMGDMKRFAELLGRPADWGPVLDSLDQEQHQFVLRNNFLRQAYITWIDMPLRPLPSQQHQQARTPRETLYGQGP